MTNEERATEARKVLEAFAKSSGQRIEDERDHVVCDLLADMMHYCREEGVCFEKLVERARMHFEEEVDEEDLEGKPTYTCDVCEAEHHEAFSRFCEDCTAEFESGSWDVEKFDDGDPRWKGEADV
jgi:hypothetical protein